MLKASIFAALLAFAVQPAVAKDGSEGPAPATAKAKSNDPIWMICQREENGTRLGARKVCLTAAQWAEKRRGEHREDIERAQRNVGIDNDG